MTTRDWSPRHHRRKRLLIYRPSPSDFLTPPRPPAGPHLDKCSPRGLSGALRRASPLERERRRILSVELRDIAQEVQHLQVETSPSDRIFRSDERPPLDSRLGSPTLCTDLVTTQEPSHTLPASPPALKPPSLATRKEETGWGLVPLFNSVRSKLESFAEIFLTPVKSRREARKSSAPTGECPGEASPVQPYTQTPGLLGVDPGGRGLSGGGSGEVSGGPVQPYIQTPGLLGVDPGGRGLSGGGSREVSGGPVQPYTQTPGLLGVDPGGRGLDDLSAVLLHGSGEDNVPPSELQRTPNNRLQPATSPSALCRPPLHRYLSCPLLPLTQHKWRHSLDAAELSAEPCTCCRKRHNLDAAEHSMVPCTCRRRRHSLGSVEECRNLSLTPFSLSCLRKENHPSVLRPYLPGDIWKPPHGDVSPADLCLAKESEQNRSEGDDRTTDGFLPHSGFQTPENVPCSKENKVSAIQIRKRALRQEGNLTPLGLPKRVRLQKEDFSLEEIYTNKNYRTPTEKRKFETIFEEPVMKGGALILTSQRPLRRIMVFKDRATAPRKRKKKGKAAPRTRRGPAPRAEEHVNYELLLQHKLNQLEAALQEDAEPPHVTAPQ